MYATFLLGAREGSSGETKTSLWTEKEGVLSWVRLNTPNNGKGIHSG